MISVTYFGEERCTHTHRGRERRVCYQSSFCQPGNHTNPHTATSSVYGRGVCSTSTYMHTHSHTHAHRHTHAAESQADSLLQQNRLWDHCHHNMLPQATHPVHAKHSI